MSRLNNFKSENEKNFIDLTGQSYAEFCNVGLPKKVEAMKIFELFTVFKYFSVLNTSKYPKKNHITLTGESTPFKYLRVFNTYGHLNIHPIRDARKGDEHLDGQFYYKGNYSSIFIDNNMYMHCIYEYLAVGVFDLLHFLLGVQEDEENLNDGLLKMLGLLHAVVCRIIKILSNKLSILEKQRNKMPTLLEWHKLAQLQQYRSIVCLINFFNFKKYTSSDQFGQRSLCRPNITYAMAAAKKL